MRIPVYVCVISTLSLLACASGQKNAPARLLAEELITPEEQAELSSNLAWQDQNDPSQFNGSGKNCKVSEQSDGTRMVYSEDNDWYLYLDGDEKVDCNVRGGGFKASNNSRAIAITVLTPTLDSDFSESGVRTEMARRSVSRVMTQFQLDHSFTYEPVVIGDAKREALCADVTFEQNSVPKHLVSCITAVQNVNGDILAHSVEYVATVKDADTSADFIAATTIAASWFRGTDSDRAGNLVNNW